MQFLLDTILVLSITINVVLSFYVLIKKIKSNYSIPFFIMCIGITLWSAANYFFQATDDLQQAFIFDQLANIGALSLSCGIYFFSRNFPQVSIERTRPNRLEMVYIIFFFLSIVLSAFPGPIDQGVLLVDGQKVLEPGPLKSLMYLLVLSGLVLCFVNLIRSYRRLKGLYRVQIGIFTTSFIISTFGGVFFNLVLPAMGNVTFVTLGPAFAVAVAVGSVYCMVNYRYTDFRVIFSDIFEKLALMSFVVMAVILINNIGKVFFPNNLIFIIFAFGIMGFLLTYVLDFVRSSHVKSALFVPDFEEAIEKFNASALKIDTIEDMITLYKKSVQGVVTVSDISIFFIPKDIDTDQLSISLKEVFSKVESSYIVFEEELKKKIDGYPVDPNLLKQIDYFRKNFEDIEAVLKLDYLKINIGYVFLGPKKQSQAFTKYDIDFLQTITNDFAVYLYKLQLYQDVKGFNDVLKTKIDEATAELQHQKSQLEEKYQFEKDMMGIMGHELRTPMTVAKGMAELVLDKTKKGDSVDNEYLGEKMDKIFKSIVKESDLIQTMLSTSHIDNNKINLQLTPVDIKEIIDFNISAFKKDAEIKGLDLQVDIDGDIPEIINDQNRVQEVVTNLISNAIKYTNEGFVKVHLELQGEFVLFSVQDSGLGIPKQEIQNIGKKFYRIHQHLDEKKDVVRAGGTGLGLYVVKGLLKAMGGELLIESEENKGSKFTALFPLEVKENENVIISSVASDSNDMFQKMGFEKH